MSIQRQNLQLQMFSVDKSTTFRHAEKQNLSALKM